MSDKKYQIFVSSTYKDLIEQRNISYTEKEYDYAKQRGLPILAFIKDRELPTTPSERESAPK